MQNSKKIAINGQLLDSPADLDVTNFIDPAVPCFRARRRGMIPVTELIVHETVTTSVATTIKVLQRRKLGVHFIIGPDGRVTQHNDLLLDRLAHAPPHNKRSVGIEVVQPYYPEHLRGDHPWKQVIDARWAHKKQYVIPTTQQAEATARLTAWLTSNEAVGLKIPRRWISLRKGQLAMGRVWNARLPKPGIYPHMAFGHADGAWLILYSWLRLEAGLNPEDAYTEAIRRATGKVRRVDLRCLINK